MSSGLPLAVQPCAARPEAAEGVRVRTPEPSRVAASTVHDPWAAVALRC
jgi:hypothetical protein